MIIAGRTDDVAAQDGVAVRTRIAIDGRVYELAKGLNPNEVRRRIELPFGQGPDIQTLDLADGTFVLVNWAAVGTVEWPQTVGACNEEIRSAAEVDVDYARSLRATLYVNTLRTIAAGAAEPATLAAEALQAEASIRQDLYPDGRDDDLFPSGVTRLGAAHPFTIAPDDTDV